MTEGGEVDPPAAGSAGGGPQGTDPRWRRALGRLGVILVAIAVLANILWLAVLGWGGVSLLGAISGLFAADGQGR